MFRKIKEPRLLVPVSTIAFIRKFRGTGPFFARNSEILLWGGTEIAIWDYTLRGIVVKNANSSQK